MQVPLEVTCRGIDNTSEAEALIRQKVAKLEESCDYLISCRVAVEKNHEHQQAGSPYRVRLILRVPPGHEIVVKRESGEGDMHENLLAVIRDVFGAARKQLQELVRKQRGDVKMHPTSETSGFVARTFPEEGYGFIRTLDNREVYFHRNSVLNTDFGSIEEGMGVRFFEEMGHEGPQASTVHVTDHR